jgi:hypothetical protein
MTNATPSTPGAPALARASGPAHRLSGFTRVTACWIAQPPKAAIVARLRRNYPASSYRRHARMLEAEIRFLFRYCRAAPRPLPTIPLGLITLAAMLPPEWSVRLVNRNTETLQDADLDWADMVMTGGMLFQQADTLCLIGLTQDRHKPVVVGGPDVTSSPHIYSAADFRVLGRRKRSSPRLSLAGRRPLGGLRGSEVPGRRYEVADPALRSAQFQGLSFRRCPILARLPVHL